ncbi:hypothetical protein CRYUN_Cryun26dG0093700 [Craigia yunnanensis]
MTDASISLSQSSETMQDLSDMFCNNLRMGGNDSAQYDEVITETQDNVIDFAKAKTGSAFSIPVDSSERSSSCCHNEGKFPIDHMDDNMQTFSLTDSSCLKNVCSDMTEMEHSGKDVTIHSNEGTGFDGIVIDDHSNRVRTNPEFLNTSKVRPSIPYQVDFSGLSAGIDFEVEEKMNNLSLEELSKTTVAGGSVVEDNNAFLAALYGNEDVYPTNSDRSVTSDLDHSSKELFSSQNSQFSLPSDEVLDDLSLSLDSEGAEDCLGTRDSDGEPLMTSYNRHFLGTVDYIWRSEGLQTVRVLAPIPKHAMQWTPGFPTKKWGSDHIALASELAFTEDRINHENKSG